MKAKFTIVHLLMLVGFVIGCSETNHDVFNDVPPPSLLPAHESNPSLHPAVSVDTVARPLASMKALPSTQEAVAAAPPVVLLVVPIVSCGAAVVDIGNLAGLTPNFLRNQSLFTSLLSIPCPVDPVGKSIKILRSVRFLKSAKFWQTFKRWNFRDNYAALKGKPITQGYEIHHSIPYKHAKKAEELGITLPINIHQPWFGIEVSPGYHRFISNSYEAGWDKFFNPFFDQGISPTRSQILNHLQLMLNKYPPLKQGSYLKW